MIISNSRKFVFIHIHKTGGTSMERALDPYLAWDDLVLGGTPIGAALNEPYKRRFGLNKHSSVQDVRGVCGAAIFDSHYIFALVRRPLDRICSLYNFVGAIGRKHAAALGVAMSDLAAQGDEDPDLLQRFPGLAFPATQAFLRTEGFAEFIRSDLVRRDRGFHAQTSRLNLSPNGAPRAEAYRLEDSNGWLPALRRRLGVEFELPRANATTQPFISPDQVPPADRRLIEELYAEDYATFGY